MSGDRRVHAHDRHVEVVRYDRSGKWFIEPRLKALRRQRVTVEAAARRASVCPKWSGSVLFGLPGGATFDRLVRKVEAEVPVDEGDVAA